jgi:hypothetical protein
VWLASSSEKALQIKQPQDRVGTDSHRLTNCLPLLVQDVCPVLVSNRVPHGGAGLVRIGGGNRGVILAVIEVPEDIGMTMVWMVEWTGVWIGLTWFWLK